uniref:Uncharacterized protein n=1 Tax=Anguilla anguilla TaxID=7936 RepID=A0A0E9TB30_ANGAN
MLCELVGFSQPYFFKTLD